MSSRLGYIASCMAMVLLGLNVCLSAESASGQHAPFPGNTSLFAGTFEMYSQGKNKVVVPQKVAAGKPWVWRARFWGHEPQFDIAMLEKGYHIVYCDVGGLLGNPTAVEQWNDYYQWLTEERGFARKVVLEGMSRGGLIIYNWAIANPDRVAAIYGDAPVMDLRSWPGAGNKGTLRAYQFKDAAEATAYKGYPVDNLKPLAKAGVPIIHVVGDADTTVPVAENTTIAEKRYKAMGGIFETIHKPGVGHHPHSLKDPSEIVNFVLKHSKGVAAVIAADSEISDKNFHLRGNYDNSRAAFEQTKRGHVAFLGGSITEMDGYRPMVCEMLKRRFPATEFTFTAAGISSTCSDTGAFRLTRDVLSKGPVDLLFVEFSVNDDQDGVYSQQSAVRGMEGILAQTRVHNPNADIVMTHFVNEKMLAALRAGKPHGAHDAHAAVAEHHGVSNNDLAQELADQINAGSMDWKTFGGVHPKKPGNRMCADMIENALLKAWERPLAADHKVEAHTVRPLMDEFSYVRGRFVDLKDIELDDTWTVSVPEWTQGIDGRVRIRFVDDTMIHGSTVGGKLKVSFTGTAIGAYVLSGPDAAIVRCSIDGKPAVEIDPIHKHSGFHYPQTVMFFDDLQRGDHVMDLEIIENRPGRTRPGGTAFRALHFTAN